MRWHVHGTDALTGEDVELAVNDQEAEQAVKAAIDRRILVSHVTADRAHSWRRIAKPGLLLAFVALAGAAAGLLAHNISLRQKLDQSIIGQSRLAQSVATAEHAASEIRAHGNLADGASEQIKKLADDLAAARSRMSLTEQQLSATYQHLDTLEAAAARLQDVEAQAATLSQQLAAARDKLREGEKLVAQLRADAALQLKRMQQFEQLPAQVNSDAQIKIAALESANAQLAAELDKLKQELLIAVAKAHVDTAPTAMETTAPIVAMPWALRTTYDAARTFLTLHTDPPTVATRAGKGASALPADETTFLTTGGVLTENALRLRFSHDRNKQRVYSATMIVPLAADAPKEKAEENSRLLISFLQQFIPGIRDADGIVTAAMAQARELSDDRRALYLLEDCKVTIWTDKSRLVTFQIEAARDAIE